MESGNITPTRQENLDSVLADFHRATSAMQAYLLGMALGVGMQAPGVVAPGGERESA